MSKPKPAYKRILLKLSGEALQGKNERGIDFREVRIIAQQIKEVRKKLTKKYKLELQPNFRCDFRDPWGNRIQVGDLSDESLVWLLPYQEVQKAGITFANTARREKKS